MDLWGNLMRTIVTCLALALSLASCRHQLLRGLRLLDIYLRGGYTLIVLSNSDRSAFRLRQSFAALVLP